MTISKYYGAWQVTCDTCNEDHYPEDAHLFMDVVGEMRELGWQAHSEEGEWVHMCPACVEEMHDV